MTQSRKLKVITLTLSGVQYQMQLSHWVMKNNTANGTKYYVFSGPADDFIEDGEPDYELELKFFADWRTNGISDYLTQNDLQPVGFQLDHYAAYPDMVNEHARWAGNLKIKAPDAGGDVRTTELTDITLPVIGKPAYTRP